MDARRWHFGDPRRTRRAGAAVPRHTTPRGTHSRTASHGTHSTPTNPTNERGLERRFANIARATRSQQQQQAERAATGKKGSVNEECRTSVASLDRLDRDIGVILLTGIDLSWTGERVRVRDSLSETRSPSVTTRDRHLSHAPAAWHVPQLFIVYIWVDAPEEDVRRGIVARLGGGCDTRLFRARR